MPVAIVSAEMLTHIIKLMEILTLEQLMTKSVPSIVPRSTSLDCDAGEFGLSGQGQQLLQLVTWTSLIWSTSEERKGWGKMGVAHWSIKHSKYFLRIFVFIKFSWPFELWEWNVNIKNPWRHCKTHSPLLCQTFHVTQESLIHIWISLRLGQVDVSSENSGTRYTFGQ